MAKGGIIDCTDSIFDVNIEGCKVENLTLDITKGYNTYAVGGIAAVIFNKANITDCSVKGLNITKAKQAGGLVGSYSGDGQLLIKNCKIMDSKLANLSSFGGMICVSVGTAKIENCNVHNVEGVCSSYLGGMAANFVDLPDVKSAIYNCIVDNFNVTGQECTGGIIGYGYNVELSKNSTINSNIINNTDVAYQNNGGIAGFLSKGTIENCLTNNVNLRNNNGKSGGILGGIDNVLVENCNVYGGSIISENSTEGVGGICGYGTNVSNCTVEDLKIEAPNTIGVAGIVGHGKNEVSTSLIQNCSVKNCKIKGKNYVGGIAGAAFINISNCQVEGSTLEGTDGVGGIQGFGGEFTDATKYVPVKIDKGEVTNTEIKGTTNVNNIQGCNTYVKDSTDPTKDTITNCKYNGSAVTQ